MSPIVFVLLSLGFSGDLRDFAAYQNQYGKPIGWYPYAFCLSLPNGFNERVSCLVTHHGMIDLKEIAACTNACIPKPHV